MIKKLFFWGIGFPKRAYTVMELRTGFATGFPILSGGLFGGYLNGSVKWVPLILFFICGYSLNIVANVANEIRAYLKQEENEKTFTEHLGSEGLVRGDATLLDAILVFLGMMGLAGLSGLLLVYLTGNMVLLILGIVGLLSAVGYSLGPKPYIIYPVGELVSGLLVGFTSSLVSSYIQLGSVTLPTFSLGWISMILTVFLMSTNNTGDFEKDLGMRLTLPHVIGFRNSILLIIPEALTILVAWAIIGFLAIPFWVFMLGCWVFLFHGYVRWYKDYVKIQTVYKEMGKEFGPRPLLVINHFHVSMSLAFLCLIYF